jgi:hypothetical protein
MKHLIRVSIISCFALFAFLGTAVVYGRTLPSPPAQHFDAAGLDVCGGKFCLFQITPGTTTYTDAKRTLANNILRDEGDHFHGKVGLAEIRVEMGMSESDIGAIVVQGMAGVGNPLSLRLRQIIQQYGLPCGVGNTATRGNGLMLNYPSFTIEVLGQEGYVSLDSPVSAITLLDSDKLDTTNTSCSQGLGIVPWHGFASIQSYRQPQQDDWIP